MSKRTYVKLAFVDRNNINTYGEEFGKLVFILTKEWADTMSKGIRMLLENESDVNTYSDEALATLLDNMSEEVQESILMGVQVGSGHNMQIVQLVQQLLVRSLNNADEMEAVLASRTPGLSLSIALAHNYPAVLMKAVNASDVEYGLHFDMIENEVFFVKENNLGTALAALSGFPLDPEERKALAGEDFYNGLSEAANDEEYGEDGQFDPAVVEEYKAMIREFENMHNARYAEVEEETFQTDTKSAQADSEDELVEETSEIEYVARVFTIFGDLADERTGHAGQLESLLNWAKSLAELDGLRYEVVRAVTTTRVTVREETAIIG